jgi:hypothetical protein
MNSNERRASERKKGALKAIHKRMIKGSKSVRTKPIRKGKLRNDKHGVRNFK